MFVYLKYMYIYSNVNVTRIFGSGYLVDLYMHTDVFFPIYISSIYKERCDPLKSLPLVCICFINVHVIEIFSALHFKKKLVNYSVR